MLGLKLNHVSKKGPIPLRTGPCIVWLNISGCLYVYVRVCACVCMCMCVSVTLLPHLLSFNSGTYRSESNIPVFSLAVSCVSFQVVKCYIFVIVLLCAKSIHQDNCIVPFPKSQCALRCRDPIF